MLIISRMCGQKYTSTFEHLAFVLITVTRSRCSCWENHNTECLLQYAYLWHQAPCLSYQGCAGKSIPVHLSTLRSSLSQSREVDVVAWKIIVQNACCNMLICGTADPDTRIPAQDHNKKHTQAHRGTSALSHLNTQATHTTQAPSITHADAHLHAHTHTRTDTPTNTRFVSRQASAKTHTQPHLRRHPRYKIVCVKRVRKL